MGVTYEFENIRYRECQGVYPVLEDSLFLMSRVTGSLEGTDRLMDMGTGTGLITLVAAEKGISTVSVDREPRALFLLRENLALNDLTSEIFLSNLFWGIPRSLMNSFDLITFNPPYVGSRGSNTDPRWNLALLGGEKGFEIAAHFMKGARKFLSKNGMILLISRGDWESDQLDPDGTYGCSEVVGKKELDGEVLKCLLFQK